MCTYVCVCVSGVHTPVLMLCACVSANLICLVVGALWQTYANFSLNPIAEAKYTWSTRVQEDALPTGEGVYLQGKHIF